MVKVNCPKCTKLISKSNLSKHLKCCKCTLIIDGRRDCRYCGKNFLSYNTTRHEKICKLKPAEIEKRIEKIEKEHEILKENQEILKKNPPLTINNLIIIMDPLALEPSDPQYEQCLQNLSNLITEKMNRIDDTMINDGSIKSLELITDKRIEECHNAIDEVLFPEGGKPRFLVTDCSRKKGVYKTYDNKIKRDAGLVKLEKFIKNTDSLNISLDNKDKKRICQIASNKYQDLKNS